MSRSRKKSSSAGWLVMAAVVAFAAAGGASYYVFSKNSTKVKVAEIGKPRVKPPTVTVAEQGREITVYVPEATDTAFYLMPMTRTVEAKGDILDAAMGALIAMNKEGGEAGSLIPKGTRQLSPIKVSKGVATVNLSTEFVGNFSGGTDQEALTLNAIAHTLVKNSGGKVERVRILVEGEAADTLGGHFELVDPIRPDNTMLKPRV